MFACNNQLVCFVGSAIFAAHSEIGIPSRFCRQIKTDMDWPGMSSDKIEITTANQRDIYFWRECRL